MRGPRVPVPSYGRFGNGGALLPALWRRGPPRRRVAPNLTWAGSRHVERLVLIAPPNAGSVDAFLDLVHGKKFGPLTPRYPPALMATFPSVYQLLPRTRHRPLVEAGNRRNSLDMMDAELWEELGWAMAASGQDEVLQTLLPQVPDAAVRRRTALEHQSKSLERARQFSVALDRSAPPPTGTSVYLIAGDAVPTNEVVAVDLGTGSLEVIDQAAGDGAVLRSSALMDERLGGRWSPNLRSPIAWSDVNFLFSDHLGMTKDPAFADNVLFLLLEYPREPLDPR